MWKHLIFILPIWKSRLLSMHTSKKSVKCCWDLHFGTKVTRLQNTYLVLLHSELGSSTIKDILFYCNLKTIEESLICSILIKLSKKHLFCLIKIWGKVKRLTWALELRVEEKVCCLRNNLSAEQSVQEQSEDWQPDRRALEELKLWHKECCPITPLSLPQDVLRNETVAFFVSQQIW